MAPYTLEAITIAFTILSFAWTVCTDLASIVLEAKRDERNRQAKRKRKFTDNVPAAAATHESSTLQQLALLMQEQKNTTDKLFKLYSIVKEGHPNAHQHETTVWLRRIAW